MIEGGMGLDVGADSLFARPDVRIHRREDGTILLESGQPLEPYSRAVGEWLVRWADEAPDRTFLAERVYHDRWRKISYRDALDSVRRIAQFLIDQGLDASRPIIILSENSTDHALLSLASMHVGIPVSPISPAYSLMSKDYGKLKHVLESTRPGLVFAQDEARFGAALRALPLSDAKVVLGGPAPADLPALPFSKLLETTARSEVDRAFERVGPDTVAKILFTSGSTGLPKGVLTTQRMLCANQQMLAQVWPFLERRPPVLVDWLPWNHCFGGNFNFGIVLRHGGTLYIDGGRPIPALIETTARNLKEISPTVYFNVPAGFALLLPFLESDARLRGRFFRELDVACYAGAALPQTLWDRLEQLARQERGRDVPVISAWGSTETAPGATAVHYPIDRAGLIGLPLPGCEIKLVPSGRKLEARLRGPHITPGYFRGEDFTRDAFDEEGFYRIGDALKLADPSTPEKGLLFDGRVAEDFKLSTGTWVSVGALRTQLIAAGHPLIRDAVITGHDRAEVGALVFLHDAAAKDLSTDAMRTKVAEALNRLASEAGSGSSLRPTRAIILSEPPSMDANETTDKGYLNQRTVLENRAALVEVLYADPMRPEVIVAAPAPPPDKPSSATGRRSLDTKPPTDAPLTRDR